MFDLLPWTRFFSDLSVLSSWYLVASSLKLPQKGRFLLPIRRCCLIGSVVSMHLVGIARCGFKNGNGL